LKAVEEEIGMKKAEVKMITEIDTEMMMEQLQLEVEPSSATRSG